MYELLVAAWEAACHQHLCRSLSASEIDAIPAPVGAVDVRGAKANSLVYGKILFNLSVRAVSPVPRRVHLAPKFTADPDRDRFHGKIEQILGFLDRGDAAIDDPKLELRSRLIETALHASKRGKLKDHRNHPRIAQDYLLYEWNIHHFHIEAPRGDHLLYVYLTATDAYVVRIGTHQHFADSSLLDDIEAAWPGLLPRIHGVRAAAALAPNDIKELRRSNVSHFTEVAGGLTGPHHMRSTSGMPVDVVRSHDMVMNYLHEVAAHLPQAIPTLETALGGEPDGAKITVAMVQHLPEPAEILVARGNRYARIRTYREDPVRQ